ncbi:hypothetical protein FRC07_002346, partial [Ceratobasidium sp. 392]
MSLFRSSSFRIKKREKAHRPPLLEGMPEHPKREAAESRTSLELPQAPANFLMVPDSARSAFFTLPSAGNSRSSLFTRSASAAASSSSSITQEDKPRSSFFKLSNLSRGSFVSTLRRERESRGRNTLESLKSLDDTAAPFARLSADLRECWYIPSSNHSESAEVSMTNMFAGLDVIDIAPQPNSSLRQRSRTLSTKSAPDTPDTSLVSPLRLLTDLSPSYTASIGRSSLDTPSRRRTHITIPPRLSLDTPESPGSGSRTSPIPSPLLTAPLPGLNLLPGRLDDALPPLPAEHLEVAKAGSHSPSPTIVSTTSASTALDSLMGSYDPGSSESDPDQSFTLGNDCGPIDMPNLSVRDDSALGCHEKMGDPSIESSPPRLTVTRTGETPSPTPIERLELPPFSFPGPPALSDVFNSPFLDPLETYLNTTEDGSEIPDDQVTPLETVTFKIKPKLGAGDYPTRRLSSNDLYAGNTPPSRRLKIRRPGGTSLTVLSSMPSRAREIIEETPPTPSTPSFLVGLAWPRPPFRQIYIDAQKPGASWHTVSNVTTERLFDGSGNARIEPCHIIMLAQAIDSFAQPQAQQGTGQQQPLSPSATSALAAFALHSRPL